MTNCRRAFGRNLIGRLISSTKSDGETFDLYDGFEFHAETFDRRDHEQRIKLDQALQTLDLRSRHIIEKRWLINECFDHIGDYIEPGAEQASPVEQEELGAFFGISRQRIGQIEDAAIARLKSARAVTQSPNHPLLAVTNVARAAMDMRTAG